MYHTGHFYKFDGFYYKFMFEECGKFDVRAIDMRASTCLLRGRTHSACGYTYIEGVLKTFVVSDAEQLPASVPALLGECFACAYTWT